MYIVYLNNSCITFMHVSFNCHRTFGQYTAAAVNLRQIFQTNNIVNILNRLLGNVV